MRDAAHSVAAVPGAPRLRCAAPRAPRACCAGEAADVHNFGRWLTAAEAAAGRALCCAAQVGAPAAHVLEARPDRVRLG